MYLKNVSIEVTFIKDIHQTLDAWRSGSNIDGLNLSSIELRELKVLG